MSSSSVVGENGMTTVTNSPYQDAPIIASSSPHLNALLKRCALAEKKVNEYKCALAEKQAYDYQVHPKVNENVHVHDMIALKIELAHLHAREDWHNLKLRIICDLIEQLYIDFNEKNISICQKCNVEDVKVRLLDIQQKLKQIQESEEAEEVNKNQHDRTKKRKKENSISIENGKEFNVGTSNDVASIALNSHPEEIIRDMTTRKNIYKSNKLQVSHQQTPYNGTSIADSSSRQKFTSENLSKKGLFHSLITRSLVGEGHFDDAQKEERGEKYRRISHSEEQEASIPSTEKETTHDSSLNDNISSTSNNVPKRELQRSFSALQICDETICKLKSYFVNEESDEVPKAKLVHSHSSSEVLERGKLGRPSLRDNIKRWTSFQGLQNATWGTSNDSTKNLHSGDQEVSIPSTEKDTARGSSLNDNISSTSNNVPKRELQRSFSCKVKSYFVNELSDEVPKAKLVHSHSSSEVLERGKLDRPSLRDNIERWTSFQGLQNATWGTSNDSTKNLCSDQDNEDTNEKVNLKPRKKTRVDKIIESTPQLIQHNGWISIEETKDEHIFSFKKSDNQQTSELLQNQQSFKNYRPNLTKQKSDPTLDSSKTSNDENTGIDAECMLLVSCESSNTTGSTFYSYMQRPTAASSMFKIKSTDIRQGRTAANNHNNFRGLRACLVAQRAMSGLSINSCSSF